MAATAGVLKLYGKGLAGFAALYLLFLSVFLAFPYLQPGDYLVADLKHRLARHGNAFEDPTRPVHVMAFGCSKTLAGFIPAQFDNDMSAAGIAGVQSYNFGIAGDKRFVADLEAMAARGTAPKLALLTFPWPPDDASKAGIFHFINNDQQVMAKLFPFRHLIRDAFVLLAEGHGFRGMVQLYRNSETSVSRVAADGGYFFMASQSHYANDQLPDNFRLASDSPGKFLADPEREVTVGPAYERFEKVLVTHKITCLLVPLYFREGEYAVPPATSARVANQLKNASNVSVAGPDYFLYPARYFSDAIHLNRAGAAVYTRDMARVVAAWMKQHGAR